ncbi:MAG: PhzF family phenazine biosynthesis protein, partial [Tannerella sp.]|nr:PhzF family phenazine biosynthesis protein [Tannerella sp.]
VRCFAPAAGINEDPVTGSAHCALTPLWAEKLGKTELDSLQLSKRTGRLKVKLNGDRVEIKGKALTVFEAGMKV